MSYPSCVVNGATLRGVEALPVQVEVIVSAGIPSFSIVGMPDAAIQESRERVKAALRTSGFAMPTDKIVVNLAPGALKKTGSGFDLPIALGLLVATGQVSPSLVEGRLVVGELSLQGEVRCVPGILAYQRCAALMGLDVLTGVPNESLVNVEGVACFGLERMAKARFEVDELKFREIAPASCSAPDYSDVLGHESAKRALQIAATGGHGAIMVGPPGSGKTMLASRFPSILPPLQESERIESALVHSVVGEDIVPLLQGIRPFRAPHHSATMAGLIGGGSPPHPGEASLAHNGVLFLDELAEFKPSVLQTLRQPMEEGAVRITRADGTYTFPASFSLLAATNPCPCGHFGDPSGQCRCSAMQVRAYQGRMGGPLLDRISIRVDVWRGDERSLLVGRAGSSSADLREGVQRGRVFAQKRGRALQKPGLSALREECNMTADAESFLLSLVEGKGVGARAMAKTLSLARTVADIEESERVLKRHVSEAYTLRFGGGMEL